MIKRLLQILAILFFGMIGGMTWQAVLLPFLAQQPAFEKLWFVKEFQERELIVFPKEEIIIQENTALTKTVEKVEKVVLGIKTKTKQGKIIEGSGFVLTSDGLIITLADLLPQGSAISLFFDGNETPFEIVQQDLEQNLALLKIKGQNLPTRGFVDLGDIKMGQRVFLISAIFLEEKPEKMVNEGIVKYFNRDFIRTDIFEKKLVQGSPLFDIEGSILGINTIDLEGKVTAIPIAKIQQFAGL